MRTARIGLFNAALGAVAFIATDAWAADWPSAGADLSNSRYQTNENKINASNVALLEVKWTFPTVGDVQAHPAVDGDYLYFPDSAGFLYKVHKKSGALIWKVKICHYTGTTSQSVPLDSALPTTPSLAILRAVRPRSPGIC